MSDVIVTKVEFELSKTLLAQVDHWVKEWGFEDRGDFFREAIRKNVHHYEDHEYKVRGKAPEYAD